MNRKSFTPLDDDRLTPEDERSLAFGIAQGNAGLTFGPFEKGGLSLRAFMKAREGSRRVSIQIPAVLFEYLQTEAKRFWHEARVAHGLHSPNTSIQGPGSPVDSSRG